MNELMAALRSGTCYIKYKSVTSNKIHEGHYTLIGGYDAPSNNYSDKLVVVSTKTKMYEDIVKDSIIEWKSLES
jgi:hypothetical protein